MALYAFDGTGNTPIDRTNVIKFFEAYSPDTNNLYLTGPGTRYGLFGRIWGGITGAGGETRVCEAVARLKANFAAGDRVIDIVGFSRGAALALDFANEIYAMGKNAPDIRFLGLWDTVASFGVPGNGVNIGVTLTLPPNVVTCRHAMALDERRALFPLTRVIQDGFSEVEPRDVQEVWFRGYHSDVGGGNQNPGLSNISLCWMYAQAQEVGLTFREANVQIAGRARQPKAEPISPPMDLIDSGKRTIQPTDVVHNSVYRRLMSGRFPANNPPRWLAVA